VFDLEHTDFDNSDTFNREWYDISLCTYLCMLKPV